MIATNIDVKKAPTKKQVKMLEEAAKRPICFDEDCPELSDEDLTKFKKISDERKSERRKQTVTSKIPRSPYRETAEFFCVLRSIV